MTEALPGQPQPHEALEGTIANRAKTLRRRILRALGLGDASLTEAQLEAAGVERVRISIAPIFDPAKPDSGFTEVGDFLPTGTRVLRRRRAEVVVGTFNYPRATEVPTVETFGARGRGVKVALTNITSEASTRLLQYNGIRVSVAASVFGLDPRSGAYQAVTANDLYFRRVMPVQITREDFLQGRTATGQIPVVKDQERPQGRSRWGRRRPRG